LKVNFIGAGVTCVDNSGQARTDCTVPAGVTDHGGLTGLGDDDHPQYSILAPGTTARNTMQPSAATAAALALRSHASQSVSLFEVQDSGGVVRTSIRGDGSNTGIISSTRGIEIGADGYRITSFGLYFGVQNSTRFVVNNGDIDVFGRLDLQDKLTYKAQTLTIADNGNGGTRATSTLTPTTGYAPITCNDPQGCDVAISETGAVDGQILRIVCLTANVCGFSDTAGVTELAGALDLGQYDSLTLIYSVDRWIKTSASDN
jgi:hypothetical protein